MEKSLRLYIALQVVVTLYGIASVEGEQNTCWVDVEIGINLRPQKRTSMSATI